MARGGNGICPGLQKYRFEAALISVTQDLWREDLKHAHGEVGAWDVFRVHPGPVDVLLHGVHKIVTVAADHDIPKLHRAACKSEGDVLCRRSTARLIFLNLEKT